MNQQTFKNLITISAIIALSACASDKSTKVEVLQKRDKTLSCNEVLLEMNEAEYYKKAAENNKSPGVKSLLMPLGYVSTYVDASDAEGAANARLDYLKRIYDILQCDTQRAMVQQNAMGTLGDKPQESYLDSLGLGR